MYIFDTNPIIYYINEESSVVQVVEDIVAQEVPLYVSTITELELFSASPKNLRNARLLAHMVARLL